MNREDLVARLRATFADELDDQVREANTLVLALEGNPASAADLRVLFRVMHTLKGAAHAVGLPTIEALCHRLESMLADARDRERPLTDSEVAALFAGLDTLGGTSGRLRRGEDVNLPVVPVVPIAPVVPTRAVSPPERRDPDPEPVAAPRRSTGVSGTSAMVESVRIAPERLDQLLAISNRLLVAAGRSSESPERARQLHERLGAAVTTWRRMRRELGQALDATTDRRVMQEFTEVGEALVQAASDAARMADEARATTRDMDVAATEIAMGVRELRLRPFADAIEALPRLVRDVAAATGKRVRLSVYGDQIQADRAVLDHVRDAVIQLARNAIDHGIEAPAERIRVGKHEEGVLRVSAELLGDRLVVSIADDGGGLDVVALRAQLERHGESVPDDDQGVVNRLFLGGLSARAVPGAISGRGVGLDVARAAVEIVRGSISVDWAKGQGTVFTLEVPLTLATIRGVLVRAGGVLMVIPSAYVQRLLRIPVAELHLAEGRTVLRTAEAPVPVIALAAILGPPIAPPAHSERIVGALLAVGERRLFIEVDELLEEGEMVVRPIRAQGRRAAPHVGGAALLPSGAIALVLNVPAAVASGLGAAGTSSDVRPQARLAVRQSRVLVVDDSITTRTLEQSVLEAAGYEVLTAVDGADGWRVLQEQGADLVVTDVEMPRMTGLELCQAARASTRFRTTPIVLITALETSEDRARGLEAGASAYLGKSSFDQDGLLDTVRQLIG